MRTVVKAIDTIVSSPGKVVAVSCLIGVIWAFISLVLFVAWWETAPLLSRKGTSLYFSLTWGV